MTSSITNIATAGTYQGSLAGQYDVFLEKFCSLGTRIWGTYYGGPDTDEAWGFAWDHKSHIYLTGLTHSLTGIATAGSHQETFGGGYTDGFIARFDTTGQLSWGTYYGGTSVDALHGCTIDNSGNVYATGSSASDNNISTPGCHQNLRGGGQDGLIAKFDSTGDLKWGTYYGGSTSDNTLEIAVDSEGDLMVCGTTNSGNNISSPPNCWQCSQGGGQDNFLCRFTPSGVRLWGT